MRRRKRKIRVPADISLTIQYPPPPDPAMSGEVTADKAKCERGRTVEVSYVPEGGGLSILYGVTTTADDGGWKLPHEVLTPDEWGDYRATATKRKIRKKRKIIVCKGAVSPAFRYPP
jgi:hypothetical protein